MAYVYCHLKRDSGEPFYVGIGRREKRAYDLSRRSKWHKDTVSAHGVRVEIIAEVESWEIAQWWEIRWIKTLKNSGYKLVNQTPGGNGGQTWLGRKHSEETKKKMSIAAKGNKGNLGKIFSEEHRRKLSLAQIGNKKSVGRKDSEDTRAKKSKAMTGKKYALGHKWTETQREKNILARTGQKRTEEQKQRMREAWVKRRSKNKVLEQ